MNKIFSKQLIVCTSLLLFFGISAIGLGIGFLVNRILESILISMGLSLIVIATLLIKTEHYKY